MLVGWWISNRSANIGGLFFPCLDRAGRRLLTGCLLFSSSNIITLLSLPSNQPNHVDSLTMDRCPLSASSSHTETDAIGGDKDCRMHLVCNTVRNRKGFDGQNKMLAECTLPFALIMLTIKGYAVVYWCYRPDVKRQSQRLMHCTVSNWPAQNWDGFPQFTQSTYEYDHVGRAQSLIY